MKNNESVFKIIGASNHCKDEREENDFYATDPNAVEELLKYENFDKNILEPACGAGHISKCLENHGYNVVSKDLINRGYGEANVDFLSNDITNWNGDIITNPPYKYAKEFVKKALSIIPTGNKVAMFLKLTFAEGQNRRKLFSENPPKTVYIASKRYECGKNGIFTGGSAVAYAWWIWKKGYNGDTIMKWI